MNELINPNNSNYLTAVATTLLVLVGLAQIFVLFSQKQQTRIALTEQYRQLWSSLKQYWGTVVFMGRENGEYYQVLDEPSINTLRDKILEHRLDTPTIWALESIQQVCGTLGEISTRVLQGHLNIADIYPIFGTQFLRQNRPLRQLLEPEYLTYYHNVEITRQHKNIKREIQDWLIYHDGLRRRCLILIDLLWAEAARLEDLPPDDMQSAAEAKKKSGSLNRKRIFDEMIRLNGILNFFQALKLSWFLKNAEYRSLTNWGGIKKERLDHLNKEWTQRLIRERFE
ncbi:hypothetical protein KTI63_17295 [Acinetobacter guillouiae]|uniref:hypothetical protein n=1 Tax=Acinetobacter guillouiae TaxID=106649 RepID=UPI0021D09758|nr:hypothetical protein [Acinetobacter guillouiae]MCU4494209.1 hypothetical protein [Acinetobacter guillouiae]